MSTSTNEYLVAELYDSIDEIVSQPIQITQRIKYTAYDVSQKYIIFGANSGGLYVFNRHPCFFIKLIPNKGGAIELISISNDDQLIAVATSKGTLYLVNNSDENTSDMEVYYEHQGSTITAIKWNENSDEVYIGDNAGKISVIVPNSFITKTMLQTPNATLMYLDSRIVQLDFYSRFLLVSTLSRCYLCDTETEHYRQIGKKLRDGEYGACFIGSKSLNTVNNKSTVTERHFQLPFRILADKESFVMYEGLENLRLFCARPGARLWEVQLSGNVVRTHQFKQILKLEPFNVVELSATEDCRLSFKIPSDSKPTSLNFHKLNVFLGQFIVAYQKNCLYVFDPGNAKVLFWTDIYRNITDIKIVNEYIYIRTSVNKIHTLLFSTIENFILKCFLNKKYLLCADLCVLYQKHIKKLLPLSKKLHTLSSLNDKLISKGALEISRNFQPILNMLKELTNTRQTVQKLPSGIFMIDNVYFANDTLAAGNKVIEVEQKLLDTSHSVDVKSEAEKKFAPLYEEYELSRIDNRLKTIVLNKVLEQFSNVQDIVLFFMEFETYCKNYLSIKDDVSVWSSEKCMEYLSCNKGLDYSCCDSKTINYLIQAFQILNYSNDKNTCTCGFPLIQISGYTCKYYDIGCKLIEINWIENKDVAIKLCHQVPVMWKCILMLRQNENISVLIPLILQFGDEQILEFFYKQLTYDLWIDSLKKFIYLKASFCLNCERNFAASEEVGLSWLAFTTQMVKSVGGESSVLILLQQAHKIPKGTLSTTFYQCSIFSTIIGNFNATLQSNAVDFVKKNTAKKHFGNLLERSISDSRTSKFDKYVLDIICSWCHMPLESPVLSAEKCMKLKCGHYFHNICYKNANYLCGICIKDGNFMS